jgi:hypothetical protein
MAFEHQNINKDVRHSYRTRVALLGAEPYLYCSAEQAVNAVSRNKMLYEFIEARTTEKPLVRPKGVKRVKKDQLDLGGDRWDIKLL